MDCDDDEVRATKRHKMRIKNANLEWYALYEVNGEIKYRNIIRPEFKEEISKRIKNGKIRSYKDLKEYLKREFMYYYWSKVEYELIVIPMFCKDKLKKIDVWSQLEPNLDKITKYVINEMNLPIK